MQEGWCGRDETSGCEGRDGAEGLDENLEKVGGCTPGEFPGVHTCGVPGLTIKTSC